MLKSIKEALFGSDEKEQRKKENEAGREVGRKLFEKEREREKKEAYRYVEKRLIEMEIELKALKKMSNPDFKKEKERNLRVRMEGIESEIKKLKVVQVDVTALEQKLKSLKTTLASFLPN